MNTNRHHTKTQLAVIQVPTVGMGLPCRRPASASLRARPDHTVVHLSSPASAPLAAMPLVGTGQQRDLGLRQWRS
jgi:hypothetical protein